MDGIRRRGDAFAGLLARAREETTSQAPLIEGAWPRGFSRLRTIPLFAKNRGFLARDIDVYISKRVILVVRGAMKGAGQVECKEGEGVLLVAGLCVRVSLPEAREHRTTKRNNLCKKRPVVPIFPHLSATFI